MKYPISPSYLDALPEPIAEIYRNLEIELIEYICEAIKHGELNEKSLQNIRILRAQGIDLEPIKKAIQKAAGLTKKQTDALFADVVEKNQRFYNYTVDLAQITAPQEIVTQGEIAAIIAQTEGELDNITRSMGFVINGSLTPPARAYQAVLDEAAIGMQSGALTYREAITRAVKGLADSGLQYVDYESGHRDHADVAARRAIMTGTSQLCDKYTVETANELGTHYYEISAHRGARDKGDGWKNHKNWQGKVYSTEDNDKYPSIYTVCGLGKVDGLEGANCRHRRFAFIDGLSTRTYTDKELAEIDPPPFKYQGKEYTAYEATQKQREIERTVRKLKREEAAYKAAGMDEDATVVRARIRQLSREYTEFSKAAGLPEQRDRMKVIA